MTSGIAPAAGVAAREDDRHWACTPAAWRVAAGGVLGGGFALGFMGTASRVGRVIPVLTAGVAVGTAIPLALATRRPPITPESAALALGRSTHPPMFSIVVGARDEAATVPGLIADLARQDYRDSNGRPRFEIVLVDDRSVDGTGDAARKAAARHDVSDVLRIVERRGEGLPDGKGAALTAAQPDICRGDIVVVLDADARLGSGFLTRAAGYFEAGAPAVTARRRILDADSGWLEGAQADEQTLDGEINRGRWAMGGCSEFRGNGIMVRRDLLARVGGWRASALTEDTDLSSRIAAAEGIGVAWAIDAEVWEEPVRRPRALWSQRKRWAEGALRRYLQHGPAGLRSGKLSRGAKLDFTIYAAQLAAPPIILGAAAGAVVRGRKKELAALLIGYFGASAILAWDSLRWSPCGAPAPKERLLRSARVSVFNGLWLAAVPRALLNIAASRGPLAYVKMAHQGAIDPFEGGDQAAPDKQEISGRP